VLRVEEGFKPEGAQERANRGGRSNSAVRESAYFIFEVSHRGRIKAECCSRAYFLVSMTAVAITCDPSLMMIVNGRPTAIPFVDML
jgi:hypothetical protein